MNAIGVEPASLPARSSLPSVVAYLPFFGGGRVGFKALTSGEPSEGRVHGEDSITLANSLRFFSSSVTSREVSVFALAVSALNAKSKSPFVVNVIVLHKNK